MGIVGFLKARLDELEQAQREPYCSTGWHSNNCALHYDDWPKSPPPARKRPEPCDCGVPALILADVAAKRQILEAFVNADTASRDASLNPEVRQFMRALAPGLFAAVIDLASVYSDHPDYAEEWLR
jgi:hypothetical protein